MSWIENTLWWYVMVLFLGVVFFPLTKILLGKFFDAAYPFAKIIGILLVSYASFVLGILHIMPFAKISLLVLIALFACLNIWIFRKKSITFTASQIRLMILEEIIFFIALFFWSFVRGQEPSLRGLEKFMDFGFMNSILRADYLPPKDMWLAGHTINYYYFGHLTGAVLIKLSGLTAAIGYNLILATIFAQTVTQIFSLCFNILFITFKKAKLAIIGAFLGLFLINLGGNLHTIYSFTKGYPNEKPQAPWTFTKPPIGCYTKNALGGEKWSFFCPQTYWYPNATRFIPFTIHEFPIYSYVVADLHGHVFDIPLVLLTLAVLFLIFSNNTELERLITKNNSKSGALNHKQIQNSKLKVNFPPHTKYLILNTILLGFLTAVNYMTNAFDGPIYLLLTTIFLFILYRLSLFFLLNFLLLIGAFIIFSLPFSAYFQPFVSGIGVNCAHPSLIALQKLGPFIFEKDNCQLSSWWMLALLWGFFWFNFFFFLLFQKGKHQTKIPQSINRFMLVVFAYGTLLILIPEFFYIKDIYPAHFRANTMFKLGYQAFIMMGISSTYVVILFKKTASLNKLRLIYFGFCSLLLTLVFIYPYFAITSYYGKLSKTPQLDGSVWLKSTYPEYKDIIDYLNKNVAGQPTILEAQGDSYTDYNIVSSYTGLPTVAGWLVHQWLWRGKPSVVSDLAPDIQTIYETIDSNQALQLIKKYRIRYVVIGANELDKYKKLDETKFFKIGKRIFLSSNQKGKIFLIN